MQPVPQPPLGDVVAGGQVVVDPPQYGGRGAPPEMQSVRVDSPADCPQNCGTSQAHCAAQSDDWIVHAFAVASHVHVHDPEQGAGVVVVDVVDPVQQVRRCSPASACSGVGSGIGG
ncbi:MAG: hypothetical protein U0996_10150 [Planctomycetaceae bacterium]